MNILSKRNLEAHQSRPLTPEGKKLTLWRPSKDFLHCCVESRGCRFGRDNGACIMCDYGIGRNMTPHELEVELERQLQPQLKFVSTVLFGSYGSVFDVKEISEECFDVILDFIAAHKIQNVIFETHCSTVTEGKLKKVQDRLLAQDIDVSIEMGYESCDEFILKHCLNKTLNLSQLKNAVKLIHDYQMEVTLNVLLGAPFLSAREQLDTALESVAWAFEQKADHVVVFPCNIKPFTLLYQLYENDFYVPVSQWMLVTLLSRISEDQLNHISLSWYGDRKNFYENDAFPLIPPRDCERCHDRIFQLYHAFMEERDSKERKKLVDAFLGERMDCDCHAKFMEELEIQKKRLDPEEIQALLGKRFL